MCAYILVAEDDGMQAELIRRLLVREGHTATVVSDGRAALDEARNRRPDLVILDVMLPGLDGFGVCRVLRRDADIPVLMLTARSAEDDLLLGLDLGADDYMTKPYSPRELLARIRIVLRRTLPPVEESPVLRVGGVTVDPVRHEVTCDGAAVGCTPGEFAILTAMAAEPERVFSRRQLLEHTRGHDRASTERAIDMHIVNLRKKIEADPRTPDLLPPSPMPGDPGTRTFPPSRLPRELPSRTCGRRRGSGKDGRSAVRGVEGNVMYARGKRNLSSGEQDTAHRVIQPSAPVQRMLDLQRTAGNTAVARMVERERHQHGPGCEHADPAVQRRETTGHGRGHDVAEDTHPTDHRSLIDAAMATPSSPLPGPFLTKAKAFYGNDALSAGRVHDNATAQRATAALGARAMTIGSHIFLGSSAVGDTETLAHETSHLDKNLRGIRETGNDNGAGVTVTDPGQGSERAAVADGAAFTAGAATAPSVVARHAVAQEADGAERPAQRVPAAGTVEALDGGPHGGPAVQRTVWEFDQGASFNDPRSGRETRWRNRSNPGEFRTSTQLGINGQGTPRHGDIYDDATQQVHSSANAKFSKNGTIPDHQYPKRESQTRRALVEAKQAISTALAMLQAAGGAPGGQLLTGLQSGFPAFRAAPPEQIATFLPRIVEVVRRIQAGLNAQGAEIALVGDGNVPRGVAGWVAPSMSDMYNRVTNPNQQKSEDLPTLDAGRSGPINLTDEGQNAWYIIHEATHRFAGTLDYQYSARDSELQEEDFNAEMASVMPDTAAASEAAMLGKRALRDPSEYSGQNKDSDRQPNWYAMGRRALMNADSYAQFILIATGARAPRF